MSQQDLRSVRVAPKDERDARYHLRAVCLIINQGWVGSDPVFYVRNLDESGERHVKSKVDVISIDPPLQADMPAEPRVFMATTS